jgi:hypothetical protein
LFARGDRSLDLGDHLLDGDDPLIVHVAALFGGLLVFDEQALDAQGHVAAHGVRDVFDIAVTSSPSTRIGRAVADMMSFTAACRSA